MDTLTFNAPILYRHLTFSEAKKEPISEINLKVALEGLQMEMSQFIDLCILLGCDYLEPIKGIGPKSALKLVREFGGLEGIIEHLREKCVSFFLYFLHRSRVDNGNRQAEKEEAAADKEDGKKRKGGVHVPEEWPWEEAKKVFAEPDVTPADQIQVCQLCALLPKQQLSGLIFDACSSNGRHQMSKDSSTFW